MTKRVLLEVENIQKSFSHRRLSDVLFFRPARTLRVLESVSFRLEAGQVAALLGPNGAGKTTLINIVSDLTRADAGRIVVDGLPVPAESRRAQGRMGYVTTNDRSFFWRLTARQNLEFFASLQGISRRDATDRAAEMLARFDLTQHADRLFHSFSAGMKKRLSLARALLHDPAVLLLDEPTNGLDARSTEELLDLVRSVLVKSGKAVLWATHRFDEVERLCDRVFVLIGGKIVFDRPTPEFSAISRRSMNFTIEVIPPEGRLAEFEALARSLALETAGSRHPSVLALCGSGDEQVLTRIVEKLLAGGSLIRQIERSPESLHKLFAHLDRERTAEARQ